MGLYSASRRWISVADDGLARQRSGQALIPEAEAARAEVINLVNNFFRERLIALPAIQQYMEQVRAQ